MNIHKSQQSSFTNKRINIGPLYNVINGHGVNDDELVASIDALVHALSLSQFAQPLIDSQTPL